LSNELSVPAEPASARLAREHVRGVLGRAGTSGLVIDKAVLLTSEIVTNAVLHGRGPIVVRVESAADFVRVEVDDTEPRLPTIRAYGAEAATGRGLPVVEMTATAWGTIGTERGKTVWVEVGRRPADAGPPDGPAGEVRPSVPATAVRVLIKRLPLLVYIEAQRQNDALLREFALIEARDGDAELPPRLREMIREIGAQLTGESATSRRQIEDAAARGETVADLELWVVPGAAQSARRLVELLDEADEFCRMGHLLTVPATPTIRRFRAWYLDEVLRQLKGGRPQSWAEDDRE